MANWRLTVAVVMLSSVKIVLHSQKRKFAPVAPAHVQVTATLTKLMTVMLITLVGYPDVLRTKVTPQRIK